MDKNEEELKAVTEAMKNTLMDLRTMMQDMDNPFNFLKEMGVEGLMSKAVEKVASEVNKAKRDEIKKGILKGGEREADLSEESEKSISGRSQYEAHAIETSRQEPKRYVSSEDGYSQRKLNEILDTLNKSTQTNLIESTDNDKTSKEQVEKDSWEDEVYYESYITLVGDYLLLRLGKMEAETLLLESLYKGWTSPSVARDLIDHVRSGRINGTGSQQVNNNLEDRFLLLSLFKSLDKPPSKWSAATHLFLLLSLIARTKEANTGGE